MKYSRDRYEVMIVAGDIPYLIRSLPPLFKLAGGKVTLMAPSHCSVHFSRFVDDSIEFDPSSNDAISKLEEIVANRKPRHVVIVDESLVIEMAAQGEGGGSCLRKYCHFVSEIQSRAKFHLWAESEGLAVPAGAICCGSDQLHSLLDQWGSLFLKRDQTSGGEGVRQIDCHEEIERSWAEVGDPTGTLVQQALGGIVGLAEMVVFRGELLAFNSSEKWRTNGVNGASTSRRLCLPDGVESLARELALKTGFHGLCGFDWVIDTRDNKPRMIEFHPRPTSGFGLGRFAGLSYEKAFRSFLLDDPSEFQRPNPAAYANRAVCCYFPDHLVKSIRQKDWSELCRWLPGFPRSRSWSLVPFNDLSYLSHGIKIMIKKLF